jgi:tRNA nucleotidyltransferase (CCA-adding enzyme)
LETPQRRFFYPPKTKPSSPERIANLMIDRDSTIIFVKLGRVNVVSDILWGQLYKTQRALRNLLLQNDFIILRDSVWSNERDINVFVFEVEHLQLPAVKKHLGPPLERMKECGDFLHKHLAARDTFSGPMLENGRWVVETRRKIVEADELLEQSLKDGGRHVGVAVEIGKVAQQNFEVLTDDVILNLYTTDSDFAEFLTNYYEGKPCWLKGK